MFKPSLKTQMVRVWWIRWIVFQVSPFIFYHFIGGSVSSMAYPADSSLWLACLAPLAMTCIMRWQFFPPPEKLDTALILFSLGVGVSAGTCLFGLFLFPPHQLLISVLSGLCILQFVPTYARRYYPEK